MPLNKSAIVALAIIVILVGSSLTAGLMQAFSFRVTGSAVKGGEIPKSAIIDYDLSPDVKAMLMQRGVTILTLSYGPTCTECSSIISYLEGMANSAKGRILLIELASKSAQPDLTISSYYGEQDVYRMDKGEVLKALCDLIIDPSTVAGLTGQCAQLKI